MNEVSFFSIVTNENEDSSIKSRLLLNQELTATELSGEILEFQFKLNEHYFLILSALESWGESVYFYLLDSDLKVIDELAIGGDIHDSPFFQI